MNQNSNDDDKRYFPSEYQITGLITLFGFIVVLIMVITSFVLPEEAISLDRPDDPANLIDAVNNNEDEAVLYIALDTFFIIGYTALFIGMYLITRDIFPVISKFALIFGVMTAIGDFIENSLLFAFSKGVPLGWEPHPMFYVILWLFAFLIDTCSYAAAILFGVMLAKAFPRNNNKFIVGILFLLYAAIGFLGYLMPIFMLIRSLFFVIGLGFATVVLLREPEISLKDLDLIINETNSDDFS